MTLADFLYQASFWQWIGMIFLGAVLSQFRIVTINNIKKEAKP